MNPPDSNPKTIGRIKKIVHFHPFRRFSSLYNYSYLTSRECSYIHNNTSFRIYFSLLKHRQCK